MPQGTRLGRARTRPLPTKAAQNLDMQIPSNSVPTSRLLNVGGREDRGLRAGQTRLKACPARPARPGSPGTAKSQPRGLSAGCMLWTDSSLAPGSCVVASVPPGPLALTQPAFWGQRQRLEHRDPWPVEWVPGRSLVQPLDACQRRGESRVPGPESEPSVQRAACTAGPPCAPNWSWVAGPQETGKRRGGPQTGLCCHLP